MSAADFALRRSEANTSTLPGFAVGLRDPGSDCRIETDQSDLNHHQQLKLPKARSEVPSGRVAVTRHMTIPTTHRPHFTRIGGAEIISLDIVQVWPNKSSYVLSPEGSRPNDARRHHEVVTYDVKNPQTVHSPPRLSLGPCVSVRLPLVVSPRSLKSAEQSRPKTHGY